MKHFEQEGILREAPGIMRILFALIILFTPSICFADLQADLDAANLKILRTQLELIKTQEAVAQQQREKDAALAQVEELKNPLVEVPPPVTEPVVDPAVYPDLNNNSGINW